MSVRKFSSLLWIAASVLFVAACHDTPDPTAPDADADLVRPSETQAFQQQDMAQWFPRAASEVLALPQTVFADHDESAGRLVFGVEHAGVARGIEATMARLGVPASAYEVKVTEPIRFMASLRDEHRPTKGGIQIHFSNFLCTLGFNVDHAGGRSFITNSHCSDQQGSTDGTIYYQPTSSTDPAHIAVEVDDPAYFKGRGCPRGRQCRYSDASRALYESGIASDGEIGRTSGPNNGSLEVVGTFDITGQDDNSTSFSGRVDKVGRTTGWTRGDVSNTCVTVNVFGSNITMLCQTLVEAGQQIVAGGDSGSPVFRAGENTAELVGILWGGSSSGNLFVFSPLSGIERELGDMDATTDGTGSGDGGGGGGGDDDGGDDGPNCPPTSNNPACP